MRRKESVCIIHCARASKNWPGWDGMHAFTAINERLFDLG